MSTLPEITEALSKAVVEGDFPFAERLALQAACKMGGERYERIYAARANKKAMTYKYWVPVKESRSPWTPPSVTAALEQWLEEAKHAEALKAAGEKVLPLLLAGETRCGKTSTLCAVAQKLGLDVKRMSLAQIRSSHLGESSQHMTEALREASTPLDMGTLWVMDELDGVAQRRLGDSAAGQELAASVAVLLTEIENLPAWTMLAATSNVTGLIDPAVLARFTVVEFPKWAELTIDDKRTFVESHGTAWGAGLANSYSDAVQRARQSRVARIIAKAKEA